MGKKGVLTKKTCGLEQLRATIGILTLISISLFLCLNSISASNLDIPLPASLGESYGTFKAGTNISLVQTCSNLTAPCDICNITSLVFPNGLATINNLQMTKKVTLFNYTLMGANTVQLGKYTVTGFCISGGTYSPWGYTFEVNYNGREITIQETYIYITGLIFLILLMFGTAFIINKLPSKDATDEEGTIMKISMLKHLRNVLWVFVFGISMIITFLISNISLAYLNSPMLGNIFFMIYQMQFYVLIIGTPIYFVWIIYKIFKDKEMKKLMERGIEFGGKKL